MRRSTLDFPDPGQPEEEVHGASVIDALGLRNYYSVLSIEVPQNLLVQSLAIRRPPPVEAYTSRVVTG